MNNIVVSLVSPWLALARDGKWLRLSAYVVGAFVFLGTIGVLASLVGWALALLLAGAGLEVHR